MGQNIRKFAEITENYSKFNCEERNYAAILYHLFLQPGNLDRFLKLIGSKAEVVREEFGIYFEYSYLRDLWSKLEDNDKKRELIRTFLLLRSAGQIFSKTIYEFNSYFGAVREPSRDYIQSPGTWSLKRYAPNIKDNEDLLNICKFKWSFNAKPDIVINTSRDTAICIEAKSESGEGFYPQKSDEVAIFKERGISRVGQTELQKYFMEHLLGIETDFVFLVKKGVPASSSHKVITWEKLFSCLDLDGAPQFIFEMIESVKT